MKKKTIITIGWWIALENIYVDNFEEVRLDFLKKYINFDPYRLREKNWKANLWESLGEEYDVINMFTPNEDSALYSEWKFALESTLEYIDCPVSLVGHSLGAIFILKYLGDSLLLSKRRVGDELWKCQQSTEQKIDKIFLVWTPLNDSADEKLGSFSLDNNLRIALSGASGEQQKKIFFYGSEDDPIVDFQDFVEYKKILPKSNFREYSDRGHFFELEKFPEIVEDIRRE